MDDEYDYSNDGDDDNVYGVNNLNKFVLENDEYLERLPSAHERSLKQFSNDENDVKVVKSLDDYTVDDDSRSMIELDDHEIEQYSGDGIDSEDYIESKEGVVDLPEDLHSTTQDPLHPLFNTMNELIDKIQNAEKNTTKIDPIASWIKNHSDMKLPQGATIILPTKENQSIMNKTELDEIQSSQTKLKGNRPKIFISKTSINSGIPLTVEPSKSIMAAKDYLNPQIVINRPEGSVVLSLPITSEYKNPESKHQSPVSADVFNTILNEINSRLQSNENNSKQPTIIHYQEPSQPTAYPQPIYPQIQPLQYPSITISVNANNIKDEKGNYDKHNGTISAIMIQPNMNGTVVQQQMPIKEGNNMQQMNKEMMDKMQQNKVDNKPNVETESYSAGYRPAPIPMTEPHKEPDMTMQQQQSPTIPLWMNGNQYNMNQWPYNVLNHTNQQSEMSYYMPPQGPPSFANVILNALQNQQSNLPYKQDSMFPITMENYQSAFTDPHNFLAAMPTKISPTTRRPRPLAMGNTHGKKMIVIGSSVMDYDTYKNSIYPLLGPSKDSTNIEVFSCSTGIRQANTTDCTKYFVCNPKTGKILSYSCPIQTAFNPTIRICDGDRYKQCVEKNSMKDTMFDSYDSFSNMYGLQKPETNVDTFHFIPSTTTPSMETLFRPQYRPHEWLPNTQLMNAIKHLLNKQNHQQSHSFWQSKLITTTEPTINRWQTLMDTLNNLPAQNQIINITPQPAAMFSQSSFDEMPMTTITTPIPIRRRRRCTDTGKVPDPENSTNYILCFRAPSGNLISRKYACTPGLIFCTKTLSCTLKKNC